MLSAGFGPASRAFRRISLHSPKLCQLSYNSIRLGFGFDGPKTAIPFLPIFRGLLERDAKATRTPGDAGMDLHHT